MIGGKGTNSGVYSVSNDATLTTMLTAKTKKKRLAALLNESRASNVYEDELVDLISEYFIDNPVDVPVKSDKDDDEDADEEKSVDSAACYDSAPPMEVQELLEDENQPDLSDSSSDEEPEEKPDDIEADKPLLTDTVHIQTVSGDAEAEINLAQAGNVPTYHQALTWKCGCTQIKVPGEEGLPGERRRVCIGQFTAQEILGMQLNCREMSKGKKFTLFFPLVNFVSSVN